MIKSNDYDCGSVLQHLSISNGSTQVDASFMQTLWNIQPTCSSGNMAVGEECKRVVHMERIDFVDIEDWHSSIYCIQLSGYLIGGHVMRLCHGHDESLTIPGAESSEQMQR